MPMLQVPTPRFKPQQAPQQAPMQQVLRDAPAAAAPDASGMSPEEVKRRREIALQMSQAGMEFSPVQHWTQGLARVAQALAGNLEEGRAQKGEDEGRKAARAQFDALQAARGADGADPKSLIAQELAVADNPWSSPGMRSVIGPMVERDMETPEQKQMRMLQMRKLENDASGETPDMKEYKQAIGQGFQGSLMDYQERMKRAGATSVNMGGGSDKQIFDNVNESAVSARSAVTGMNALNNAERAIKAGGIFGAGADFRLDLAKAARLLGIGNEKTITNTETFRSAIAPQVAAMLKATVGTAQVSNSDREFAERAAGGSINLDPGTITRLIGIMKKASGVILENHRTKLDAVYPEGQGFDRERALFNVPNMPTGPSIPDAAAQRLKANPHERDLFDKRFGPGASDGVLGPMPGGSGGPEILAPPPAEVDPYGIQDLTRQRLEMTARHKRMLSKP